MSSLTVYLIRNATGHYFTGDLRGGGKYAVFSPDRSEAFELSAEEVTMEMKMHYMPQDARIEEDSA